ncbi:GATA zinc finger domain-containing protein 14-like [Battus philenor]|uniref:GATA zinc finger domain-containing protein 14-like n=1 Tax=Battus philenor TaxID=42288 RepID=UPI0035D089CA
MFDRILNYLFICLLLLEIIVDGRKQTKTKQSSEIENPVLQPNVLTYSTFGFNDVGSYDGFVPTSPDYANQPNKYKESSEKLYAPAFPSAQDSDFTSNSQAYNRESLVTSEKEEQPSVIRYNTANVYSSSSLQSQDILNKNSASDLEYAQSSVVNDRPVYGTKLSSNKKGAPFDGHNDTESNSGSYQNDNKYQNFDEYQSYNDNKQLYSELINNKENFNNYPTTYPTADIENSMKAAPVHSRNLFKFPKVVDFTNNKPIDTMETDNKYSAMAANSLNTVNSLTNSFSDDKHKYFEEQNDKFNRNSPNLKDITENKNGEEMMSMQQNLKSYQGHYNKFSNMKSNSKIKKMNYEYADEVRVKPWTSEISNNDKKLTKNVIKDYEYKTNVSSTRFKHNVNDPKKQFNYNADEIISSSSNNIHLPNFHSSENEYINFKTRPNAQNAYNHDDNNDSTQNIETKYNPSLEYLNNFKQSYSHIPTTSTNWGNIFKSTDYSSYKTHNPQPVYKEEETTDTVHIPKRPNGYRYGKNSDYLAFDYSAYNKKPSKNNNLKTEWNKENYSRFKSEEDLLGLRNHDTSHPSYLPTYQYNPNENPEENFKTAVEKWREEYIKSKYRDVASYDYEASEAKPAHALNPYQIEVPQPVIVPVPQPYPVQVPIAKPVGVPVVQEITVPIEKPVPYPVYKKVPYPVEKLVPVPVLKQVPVPVVKPYAVPVPKLKSVFHHPRPYRDEYDLDHDEDEGDDYFPRPESSKLVYSKRPVSTRNRSRKPSRISHHEHKKSKRQQRRPNSSHEREQHRYAKPFSDYHRFRYHDADSDDEREYSGYFSYCKRIGNC